MKSASENFTVPSWITGYPSRALFCATISLFGLTGYYADLLMPLVPDWVGVVILVSPLALVLMVQRGEAPDWLVYRCHLIAATLFLLGALGMEIGCLFGYQPDGHGLFRVLAHLGWTFAWADLLREAKGLRRRVRIGETQLPFDA
tara:strand:+ start:953 stop:1387 length:435 start_codon:yes stop_codon:yes gene_type:complete